MPHHELVERHADSLGESVSAVRDASVEDLDPFNRHALSGMLSLSARIEFLLSNEETRNEVDTTVTSEYRSLKAEIDELRSSDWFQEQASSELETRIDHFENMVENIETNDSLPDPFDNMIWSRDSLEFGLDELDSVRDVDAHRSRLEDIDERFRRAYETHVDDILERAPHIERS